MRLLPTSARSQNDQGGKHTLTINTLRQFGANVQDGLTRCLNDEGFYLEMVQMALDEKTYKKLSDAIGSGDIKAVFEAAHALKGVLANVALTPLYDVASEITELSRSGQDADYPAKLEKIMRLRGELIAL